MPKTYCFDLDGTLCTNTHGDYESAQPFPWAIERVNALAQAGHKIIVMTARGATTGIDWTEVTAAQLDRWGVRYDELHLGGKPGADVYVDDKAMHVDAWRYGHARELPVGDEAAGAEFGFGPALPPPRQSAVVEITRTYGGSAHGLAEHVRTALGAAASAGIPVYMTAGQIEAAAERATAPQSELLDAGDDVVFAIALTGAEHAAYLDAAEALDPGVTVSCRLLSQSATGLRRFVEPGEPIAVRAGTRGADELPDAWPLAIDAAGEIHDMLGGELWALSDGTARVARRAGATSELAASLAAEAGVAVADGPLTPDHLAACEEAFLVGMPFCVVPVGVLDRRRLEVGAAAAALADAWSETVGIDLRRQLAALVGATTAARR